MALEKKLTLEKTKRGYEVQNEHFNWIGDVYPVPRSKKKAWTFHQAMDRECTLEELEQVVELMKGLT